ncbi:uncharacterized protein LOC141730144 [Zonotrichia albicollis]|uniref:uncharacterized protein LOC141730144 n=1 Tax=Zonotrichia albicollis TaxID=44394 RepID=UPI003D8109EA
MALRFGETRSWAQPWWQRDAERGEEGSSLQPKLSCEATQTRGPERAVPCERSGSERAGCCPPAGKAGRNPGPSQQQPRKGEQQRELGRGAGREGRAQQDGSEGLLGETPGPLPARSRPPPAAAAVPAARRFLEMHAKEGADGFPGCPASAGKAAEHPGQPHLTPPCRAVPCRAGFSCASSRPVPATVLAARTQGQSRSREENRDNKRLYPDVRFPWPRHTRRGLGRLDFKEKGVYFLKGRKRWVKMRRPRFPWQAAGQEPNPLETRSALWNGSTAPAQSFSTATNWKDIKASRQHSTNQGASTLHSPPPTSSVYKKYKY